MRQCFEFKLIAIFRSTKLSQALNLRYSPFCVFVKRKSFGIAITLIPLLYSVFGRTGKSYSQIFDHLLVWARVTRIGVTYVL